MMSYLKELFFDVQHTHWIVYVIFILTLLVAFIIFPEQEDDHEN